MKPRGQGLRSSVVVERDCVVCGERFVVPFKYPRQKCCSAKCSIENNRRKSRIHYQIEKVNGIDHNAKAKAKARDAKAREARPDTAPFVHADGARRTVVRGKLRNGQSVRVEIRGRCAAGPRGTYSAQQLIHSMTKGGAL